jgi:hypothetical protein
VISCSVVCSFSEVFCVQGLCLLYFHHAKRKCLNNPDTFCYACGEVTFKCQRGNFTPLIKKYYELYFGCKLGDQDKSWAPRIFCAMCARLLTEWVNGLRLIPFAVPIFWREPQDHSCDCYFCLTTLEGIASKSKQSEHTVKYPNLLSEMRPVLHKASGKSDF